MIEARFAVVEQGVVTNIVAVDPTKPERFRSLGGILLLEGSPVAVGWTHDGKNFAAPPQPAQTNDERIATIKNRAGEIIRARYPQWKQSNMLARMLELVNIKAAGGQLTPDEQAEEAAMAADWEWVKGIRAKSDAAEAAGTPAEQVNWGVL